MGRGPSDAARVEEATEGCRGHAAGRSLARVSRRRILANRPKRVRHCCRSVATALAGREGGARQGWRGGERSTPREEKTTILGRRAHARARPHDAPAALTPTRDGHSFLFELSPLPLFWPRRIASRTYALARTSGDAVRGDYEETQQTETATKRFPERARSGSARSKLIVVENDSDIVCIFLTGDRCFASSVIRYSSPKIGAMDVNGFQALKLTSCLDPRYRNAIRVRRVSLGG